MNMHQAMHTNGVQVYCHNTVLVCVFITVFRYIVTINTVLAYVFITVFRYIVTIGMCFAVADPGFPEGGF